MNPTRLCFALLPVVLASGLLASCSTSKKNQDDEEKKPSFTEKYENYQQKRQNRADDRQRRTDAWFNRILGQPVKDPNTGLKIPE